ncbi:flagellin [Lacrimispora sp. 38-1]|uniref:flagellin n=1 Tax=Lacrimispora sp. 38-1 TaxID=3125778 RepID=UPI003CF07DF5
MDTKSLGIAVVDVSTQQGAKAAIGQIKNAINQVSSTRGDLGAVQNRLEHTINNLSVTKENMSAAESRVRDVDMASEMMSLTKNKILVQASQAMLAQANQIPEGVLQLLK